jgi:hypothetical protein
MQGLRGSPLLEGNNTVGLVVTEGDKAPDWNTWFDNAVKIFDLGTSLKEMLNQPGKQPGDNTVEYKLFTRGDGVPEENSCALSLVTRHETGEVHEELLFDQGDPYPNCNKFTHGPHIYKGHTVSSHFDVPQSTIDNVHISASGPSTVKLDRLLLRFGSNLIAHNFEKQVVVLSGDVVAYCAPTW